MEVQLFDSLFRVPDLDSPSTASGANGGGSVGEKSSAPVKKPVVSVEVVSIIESVCNATGQCDTDTSHLFSIKGALVRTR